MTAKSIDPRTKLFLVMCITSLAIIIDDKIWLSYVLIFSVILSVAFKSNACSILWNFRKFIWIFILMILIQSIFTRGGEVIISLGNITILTDKGFDTGLSVILRLAIIFITATILSTSSSRDIIQGISQCRVPYELVFMIAVAIRFLSRLSREVNDSYTALQLRGVDFSRLKLRVKIQIYSYLIMPMIASITSKAKDLSMAVEMRGFRACPQRTSLRRLRCGLADYLIMTVSILSALSALYIYFFA